MIDILRKGMDGEKFIVRVDHLILILSHPILLKRGKLVSQVVDCDIPHRLKRKTLLSSHGF